MYQKHEKSTFQSFSLLKYTKFMWQTYIVISHHFLTRSGLYKQWWIAIVFISMESSPCDHENLLLILTLLIYLLISQSFLKLSRSWEIIQISRYCVQVSYFSATHSQNTMTKLFSGAKLLLATKEQLLLSALEAKCL